MEPPRSQIRPAACESPITQTLASVDAAVRAMPPAAVQVGRAAVSGAFAALAAALDRRPTTRQLWHSAVLHAWHAGTVLTPGSAAWYRSRDVFNADLNRVAADLFADPEIRAWFREGTADLHHFLVHHMLQHFGRPDLALGFPVRLRQWLPRQVTGVTFTAAGLPLVEWGGPPAEIERLKPFLNYVAREAGAPQNQRGRPSLGPAPREPDPVFEARLEETLLTMIAEDEARHDYRNWRSAARDVYERMAEAKGTFYRKLGLSGWRWDRQIMEWLAATVGEYAIGGDDPDWRPSRSLLDLPRLSRNY